MQSTRQRASSLAADGWQGRFADELRQRRSSAATGAGSVASALRQAASDLARAWADAQHQQQLYLYYAMVEHKKDHRNVIEQGPSFFGLDSIPTGHAPPPPGRARRTRLRADGRAPGPGAWGDGPAPCRPECSVTRRS